MKHLRLSLAIITFWMISSHLTAQPMPPNIWGMAVATCYSGPDYSNPTQDGFVVGVIDVHSPPGTGVNWPAPMYHGPGNSWKASRMGQVFGIAIDKRNNVFVTAADFYKYRLANVPPSPLNFGSAGTAGIYKLDGVTGSVSDFVTSVPWNAYASPSAAIGTNVLPNGNGVNTGPALGNICYSQRHDRLYVTNFEDGTMYAINAVTGKIVALYDPVVPANPGTTTNPAMTADSVSGGVQGIVPIGERIWGIGYNQLDNRIYYSVWVEDLYNKAPTTRNIIRSVALDGSGNFIPASDRLEIELPNFVNPNNSNPYIESHPVSDIEFSSNGNKILLGERSMWSSGTTFGTDAHISRVFEFSRPNVSSAWNSSPKQIYIGAQLYSNWVKGANSAGGIDYGYGGWDAQRRENLDCDSVIWGTGDYLLIDATLGGPVYGLQRSPANGQTFSTIASTGYFIDLNGNPGTQDKFILGDVDIFRDSCNTAHQGSQNCKPLSIQSKSSSGADSACCFEISIAGIAPGVYSTITAQMLTDSVTFTGVVGPNGWGVTNSGTFVSWTPPGNSIPGNITQTLDFCVNSLVNAPQKIEVTQVGLDGSLCKDTLFVDCPKLPPPAPSCIIRSREKISCRESGPNGALFDWSFVVTNNSPMSAAPWLLPAENLLVYSITTGVTVTPNLATFSPVTFGGSTPPLNFSISGPNAIPGKRICIVVQIHGKKLSVDYQWCCPPDTLCFDLPECRNCCDSTRITVKPEKIEQVWNTGVSITSAISVTPKPVVSVMATVVSATRSDVWCPKYSKFKNPVYTKVLSGGPTVGQITSGTTTPAMPLSSGTTPPTSYVEWGVVNAGVPFNSGSVRLGMDFPAAHLGSDCRDTLRICVKYTFTDTSWVSCDTVICHTIARFGLPEFKPTGDLSTGGGLTLTGSVTPGIDPAIGRNDQLNVVDDDPIDRMPTIAMQDRTHGILSLRHWRQESLQVEEPIRLTSMEVEAGAGVEITVISEQGTGVKGVVKERKGSIPLDLNPGEVDKFDLTFINSERVDLIPIYITYHYTDGTEERVSGRYQIYANINWREAMQVATLGKSNPLLYKLSVSSGRFDDSSFGGPSSAMAPHSIRITLPENVKLLATGPTENQKEGEFRLLKFDDTSSLLFPVDPSGGDNGLLGSNERVELWLVIEAGAEKFEIQWEGLNNRGEVISEGSVELDPTTSVQDGDGLSGSSIHMIDAWPNPLRDQLNVQFILTHRDVVDLSICDLAGNRVATLLSNESLESGSHLRNATITNLPNGTYYIRLATAEGVQMRKMVKTE